MTRSVPVNPQAHTEQNDHTSTPAHAALPTNVQRGLPLGMQRNRGLSTRLDK